MSHLETLIAEYYAFNGYLLKQNVMVGRLSHGGWEMELDIIAYHPGTNHLIHLEPSIDAHSWAKREERYKKKFTSARKYIFTDIFPWLCKDTPLEQVAVLITHPKDRNTLAGGLIISIDEFLKRLRDDIAARGIAAKNAIPEQYPLLRTMQLSHNGYYKRID